MKTARQRKPQVGMEIVWRFKDNKGWCTGFVREIMAQGIIIRITDSMYASHYAGNTVALNDIDWHLK